MGFFIADCPESPVEIQEALGQVEELSFDTNTDALVAAASSLRSDLGCTPKMVTAGVAGRLHRVFGLVADLHDGDIRYFSAARDADPTLGFEFPATQDMLKAWATAPPLTRTTTLTAPARASLIIDGQLVDTIDPGAPSVVQVVDASDTVRHTLYLSPGVIPDLSEIDTDDWPRRLSTAWTRKHLRPSTGPLAVAAVAIGSIALGSVAYSAQRRSAFNDLSVARTETELTTIRRQVNVSNTTASVAGIGAAVLLVGTMVSVKW